MKSRVLLAVLLALTSLTSIPAAADNVLRMQLPGPLFLPSLSPEVEPQKVAIEVDGTFPQFAMVGDALAVGLTVTGALDYGVTFVGSVPDGLAPSDTGVYGNFYSPGLYVFKLRAVDDTDDKRFAITPEYTIEVDPVFTIGSQPAIVQATLGDTVTVPTIVSGGKPPYRYEVAGGASVAADGLVSVTSPAAAGQSAPMRVTAFDGRNREISGNDFAVNWSQGLSLSYGGPYTFRQGVSSSVPVPTVAGGRGVRRVLYPTTVIDGMTPAINGSWSGIPTAVCSQCVVTGRVTDEDNRSATGQFTYSVVPPLKAVGNQASYVWRKNVAIAPFQMTLENAIGNVTWGLNKSLPVGVLLGADGRVSGTPTAAGAVTDLIFTGTDTTAPADSVRSAFTVVAPTVSTVNFNVSHTGSGAFSLAPGYGNLVSNGGQTRVYSLGGAPSGMAINQSTGAISWATPVVGVYNSILISVKDTDGSIGQGSINLTVYAETAVDGGNVNPSVTDAGSGTNSYSYYFTYPQLVYLDRAVGTIGIRRKSGSGSCSVTLRVEVEEAGSFKQIYNGLLSKSGCTSNTYMSFAANAGFVVAQGRRFRFTMDWTNFDKNSTNMQMGTASGVR